MVEVDEVVGVDEASEEPAIHPVIEMVLYQAALRGMMGLPMITFVDLHLNERFHCLQVRAGEAAHLPACTVDDLGILFGCQRELCVPQ